MTTQHFIGTILALCTQSVLSNSHSYSSQSHPLSTTQINAINPGSALGENRSSLFRGRARISTDPIDVDYSETNRIEDAHRHEHRLQSIDTLNHFPHLVSSTSAHRSIDSKEGIRLTIHSRDHAWEGDDNDNDNDLSHGHERKYLKTGTTIVGVQTRGSIILAADTRATEGTVVADTRCEKVHQLSRNVWCCGAGTSADLDALTRKVRYTFLLKGVVKNSVGNDGFSYGCEERDGADFRNEEEEDINLALGDVTISSICQMIREELTRGGGQIGANLVLGGVDPYTNQPILTAIHPHGSIDVVPYTALGSGGLAAMGVLEAGFDVDMTVDEGVELVKNAVLAGIKNDMGSGSQVDLIIIDSNGVTYKRGIVAEETLKFSKGDKDLDDELYRRHAFDGKAKTIDGVNGFGSLPYRIKSRNLILPDESILEKQKQKWVDNIIG